VSDAVVAVRTEPGGRPSDVNFGVSAFSSPPPLLAKSRLIGVSIERSFSSVLISEELGRESGETFSIRLLD
jgi:hypothetical protein